MTQTAIMGFGATTICAYPISVAGRVRTTLSVRQVKFAKMVAAAPRAVCVSPTLIANKALSVKTLNVWKASVLPVATFVVP